MALLNFKRKTTGSQANGEVAAMLVGHSLEVMPRTAANIEDFSALLPKGTRVYVAHIDGTDHDDMVACARRLAREGFDVMPHFPARSIPDRASLADLMARYQGEAGVNSGLILAGGIAEPRGDFHSSRQLLETGLFEKSGFTRLHVAGHPEGNRDIDPKGGDATVMEALRWKAQFAKERGIDMAIVTQFMFEAEPAIAWANGLRDQGIDLPIHLGIAGPAKLQTLIKFAIACGVGPSLKVLQKRARDVTKLVLPFEPDDLITDLARAKAAHPDFPIDQLHLFPLGGIKTSANWAAKHQPKDPA